MSDEQVEMLHVGMIIPDDADSGDYREIPYTKPPSEVGGCRFVWGRWTGTPVGVLEVYGPATEVRDFFTEKKAQILADDTIRFSEDTIMG